MTINEFESWDENSGDVTLIFEVEDPSLAFKAEWHWGCHDGCNTVFGTIGGREFVWRDPPITVLHMVDGSVDHYKPIFKLLVQKQIKEWSASDAQKGNQP
jgi:hypothetical protein